LRKKRPFPRGVGERRLLGASSHRKKKKNPGLEKVGVRLATKKNHSKKWEKHTSDLGTRNPHGKKNREKGEKLPNGKLTQLRKEEDVEGRETIATTLGKF